MIHGLLRATIVLLWFEETRDLSLFLLLALEDSNLTFPIDFFQFSKRGNQAGQWVEDD